MILFQKCRKGIHFFGIGLFKIAAINGIVFNNIHLARYVLTKVEQLSGIIKRIVEILKDNILVSYAGSRFAVEIFQCFGEYVEGICFINTHDFVSLLVIGSV